jgi:hypothetical protein
MRRALLCLAVILTVSRLNAEIFDVPSAYPTIQEAIDSAVDGDTVLIAPGTYSGEGNTFLHTDGKAVTITSQNGAEATIIDCDGGSAFYIDNSKKFSRLYEDSNTVVSDLTIRSASTGLNLFLAWPKLEDLVFRNCGTALGFMPGKYEKLDVSGALIVRNCTFDGASFGTGNIGTWITLLIDNCHFENISQIALSSNGVITCKNSTFINTGSVFSNENHWSVEISFDSCSVDGTSDAFIGNCSIENTSVENATVGVRNNSSCYGNVYVNQCSFKNISHTVFDIAGSFTVSNSEIIENPGQVAVTSGGMGDECMSSLYLYGCIVSQNGGGINSSLGSSDISIVNTEFSHNQGGIDVSGHFDRLQISNSLYTGNSKPINYSSTFYSSFKVSNSTIVTNDSGGVVVGDVDGYMDVISNSIIAFNQGVGLYVKPGTLSDININCNDVYANSVADYGGIADQTGQNGNMSDDPLFCDILNGDFQLNDSSSCAPDNNDCTRLIGAYDVGCAWILCGDINNDYMIGLEDVVYLINYIFKGGPPPDPQDCADSDCSGSVNLVDAVYLVRYLYSGGQAPCDTDNDGFMDCIPGY